MLDRHAASPDRHAPKPLSDLVVRELTALVTNTVASASRRAAAFAQAGYVHPRARLVRAGNLHLEGHCQIHAGATIRAEGSQHPAIFMARYCIIRENAYLDAHGGWIELGKGVFVGQNAVIYGQGGVAVGTNTLLSPGVTIISAEHGFDRLDVPIKFQPESFRGVSVGAGCWLGANVVVLDGVHIGTGTVVGAGAVVDKDLPCSVVAMGIPARVVRRRTP